MDEKQEKTTTQNQSKETASDNDNGKLNTETDEGAGNEIQKAEREIGSSPMINEAKKQASRLQMENEKLEKNLKKLEDFQVETMLAGRSTGGATAPQLSEEDKKKAGAKEFFKGTELEKAIDKI